MCECKWKIVQPDRQFCLLLRNIIPTQFLAGFFSRSLPPSLSPSLSLTPSLSPPSLSLLLIFSIFCVISSVTRPVEEAEEKKRKKKGASLQLQLLGLLDSKRYDWFARAVGLSSPRSALRSFGSVLAVTEVPEATHTRKDPSSSRLFHPLLGLECSPGLSVSLSSVFSVKGTIKTFFEGKFGGHSHNETVQVTVFQVAAIIFLTATGGNWSAENDSLMTSYWNSEFNGILVNVEWDENG